MKTLLFTLCLSLPLTIVGCGEEKDGDPAAEDTAASGADDTGATGDDGGADEGDEGDDTGGDDGSGDDGSGDDGSGDDGSGDDGSGDDGSGDDGSGSDGDPLDTGDGGDDTGEEETDTTDDWYAEQACAMFKEAGEVVIAATTEEEAAQAVISPTLDTIYEVQRSGEGDLWITLEIPSWHVELRAFANPGTTYEIYEVDESTSARLNGVCPEEGLSDKLYTVHDWGSYLIRFDEASPDPILFAVFEEL